MFSIIVPQALIENDYVNQILNRLQSAGQEFQVDEQFELSQRQRLIAAGENTILIIGSLEITENLITVRNMRTNRVTTVTAEEFFENVEGYANFAWSKKLTV